MRGTRKHKYYKKRNKTSRLRSKVSGGSTIQINARKSYLDPANLVMNTVITSTDDWTTVLRGIDENIKGFGIQAYINRKHNEFKPVKTIKIQEEHQT
jgi:hypothetical protein